MAGATLADAGAAGGVSESGAIKWVAESGGMIPDLDEPSGRFLSLAEREEIAAGWHAGLSRAQIARRIGRHRATVGRELRRNRTVRNPTLPPRPDGTTRPPGPRPGTNRGRDRPQYEQLRYRASVAQWKAEARARRPKPGKLATHPNLHRRVADDLARHWSPRQITRRLRSDFPDRPEMWVSHETIYQALYVQGRGELRGKRSIPDTIMISARPAEANDRAIPGHWEGDLIIGKDGRSAIGTLVERTTRYLLLLHLPTDHSAETVREAMLAAIRTLPQHLWRSLTWDQGSEMARHAEITLATGLDIYFCDPHSPWQRGSNENTNGLLRANYFPKATNLATHTPEHLAAVAAELNGRPRETLNWQTPAEALHQLLSNPTKTNGVATTP